MTDIERILADCLQEAVDEACREYNGHDPCVALDKVSRACKATPGQCKVQKWREALEQARAREALEAVEAAGIDGGSKCFQNGNTHSMDAVSHPRHYAEGYSHGAEVIDITEALNFNRGNVVKYVCRAGKKDPDKEREDLEKAAWYLRRELARIKEGRR